PPADALQVKVRQVDDPEAVVPQDRLTDLDLGAGRLDPVGFDEGPVGKAEGVDDEDGDDGTDRPGPLDPELLVRRKPLEFSGEPAGEPGSDAQQAEERNGKDEGEENDGVQGQRVGHHGERARGLEPGGLPFDLGYWLRPDIAALTRSMPAFASWLSGSFSSAPR